MQPDGDNTIFFPNNSSFSVGRKVGQANFFQSPQIAKPQILGLIPQLQIRKFLSCARILYRKSEIL